MNLYLDNRSAAGNPTRHASNSWIGCGKLGLFLGIVGLLIQPWDGVVAAWLDADGMGGDLRRFFALTEFFAHGFGIVFILFATWILVPDVRRRIPRVVVGLLLSSLIVHALKISVVRMRPSAFEDSATVIHNTWLSLVSWADPAMAFALNSKNALQSFPSGHSAAAAGLALGLMWLLGRGRGLFVTMAILGCAQRIEFDAHWPSDVLVGASIGILTMGFLCRSHYFNRLFARFEKQDELRIVDEDRNSKQSAA